MEEARRMALADAAKYNLTGDIPDPNWAQPAETSHLAGVELDQARGFWINGGKMGGKKDDQVASSAFSHDLETLAKDGPTELPNSEWAESKLTPSEIEQRMKGREKAVPEGLSGLRVSG